MDTLFTNKHLTLQSQSSLKDAEYIILGVPFDGTSTHYPGSRFAPLEIRKEFLELEKDEKTSFWEEINFHDMGNIESIPSNTTETLKRIKLTIQEIREANEKAKLIVLGGEHLITLPIIQAQPDIEKIISLDAHLDLKDEYQGEKLTHASVLRRIHEEGKTIEIYGARSYDQKEKEYAQKENIIYKGPEYFPEQIKPDEKTHITVDLDVLDLSETHGVGNPTPNGITYKKLKDSILSGIKKTKSFDFTETNPLIQQKSAVITAQLILEIMTSKL